MLDILKKHLEEPVFQCVVANWIKELEDEEQKAFALLKQNQERIVFADLYKELSDNQTLPFKITAFRSHMKGYCTCQKS
jgi:hypothetical protein